MRVVQVTQPVETEVLLFDLGGVVLDIDPERTFASWAKHSSLHIDELRNRFVMDDAYRAHERGEMAPTEYFEHLRQVFELQASDAQIAVGWNALLVGEIEQTLEMVERASARLRCYAFSNTNSTHQATWSTHYPRMVSAFEHIFVSSDIGRRKPEFDAFMTVSESIGVQPSALMFFDDSMENVEAARAASMRAVHVRGPGDVQQALADVGAL